MAAKLEPGAVQVAFAAQLKTVVRQTGLSYQDIAAASSALAEPKAGQPWPGARRLSKSTVGDLLQGHFSRQLDFDVVRTVLKVCEDHAVRRGKPLPPDVVGVDRWKILYDFVVQCLDAGQDAGASTIDQGRWDGVLEDLQQALQEWQHPVDSPAWPLQVGRIPELPLHFQYRDEARALAAALDDGEQAVLGQQVVSGTGGVGKTQLAAHYAHAVRYASGMPGSTPVSSQPEQEAHPQVATLTTPQPVDLLVWVSASGSQAVVSAYAQAEAAISGPGTGGVDAAGTPGTSDAIEQAAQRFLSWLQATDRSWLVVLDDVASPGDLKRLWPPRRPDGRGRVIVTTRSREAGFKAPGRAFLPVGMFTEAEAVAYLGNALAQDDRAHHNNIDDELAGLARDLGYLPLALSQAAAYVVDADMPIDAYRHLLADRARTLSEVLPDISGLPDDQAHTVAAAWDLSIRRADSLAPVGLARPLLQLLSVLDGNGVPESVVVTGLALSYLETGRRGSPTTGVTTKTPFTGAATDEAGGGQSGDLSGWEARAVDAHDARGALRVLHRLNLVDHATEHALVRVHQLIQRTAYENRGRSLITSVLPVAADALMEVWQEDDEVSDQILRANAHALIGHNEASMGGGIGPLWLRNRPHQVLLSYAESLGQSGAAAAARDHYAALYETVVQLGSVDQRASLAIRNNHAHWRGEAGDPGGAAAALAQLVPDQTQVFGPDHPATLTVRNNLARWQGLAGDAASAAEAFKQLLADQLRVLGADHRDTLVTRNNLARWQGQTGDAAGAAEAFKQLLADRLRVLGPDDPDTLVTRNNLAHWRGQAGDPSGAAEEFTQVLADRLRVLGPDDPDTLRTRNNLAHWRGQAGDPSGALQTYEQLLPDFIRVFGSDHPATLTIRNNLADTLSSVGDHAGADSVFRELLPDLTRVLGADHPVTLTTRVNIATHQEKSEGPAGAARSLQELVPDLVRVFGPDHPTTLTGCGNLAEMLSRLGDHAGAAEAFRQLLSSEVRVFGTDHPRTLLTRSNLAANQGQAGDAASATAVCKELIPDLLRVFGSGHPATLTVQQQLAHWHGMAGDPASAVAAYQQLLRDLASVMGPGHPMLDVMRENLAYWQEQAQNSP
ncbi:tetratricopeptide repeat protein [Streptomyces sp. NPDC058246]|uniref:tetratricopeptide repeat protein n=1 Tax=Streptomyces sp. NPDC058246 TaxID=3346400 RepID=UPI0036E3A923